jgi:hypothetical protein
MNVVATPLSGVQINSSWISLTARSAVATPKRKKSEPYESATFTGSEAFSMDLLLDRSSAYCSRCAGAHRISGSLWCNC